MLGVGKTTPLFKKDKMKEQIIPAKELEANKEIYLKQLKFINGLLHQPITDNEVVKIKIINNTFVINVRPK